MTDAEVCGAAVTVVVTLVVSVVVVLPNTVSMDGCVVFVSVVTDSDVEDILLFVDCVVEINVCVNVSSVVVDIVVSVGGANAFAIVGVVCLGVVL